MAQPFQNLRVLDLTHVLAGPYCTYQLALLGADVIKVEPPERPDCARARGSDNALNAEAMGLTYQVQGGNKRSIAINLRQAKGRDILLHLVRGADVLVENYRTGALAELGLGADRLREANPALVHCSITGFGQAGDRASVNAYDNVIQAASGLMVRTGSAEQPVKAGASMVDYATGMAAAFAIAAALFRRAATGEGEAIDVAMFDVALSFMAPEIAAIVVGGTPKPKEAGLGTYRTSDGWLTLGIFTPDQNSRFWRALGRDDFAALQDFEALWREADAMRAALAPILAERTAAEWETWLHALGMPGERVRTLEEALSMPHLGERGFLAEFGGVTVPTAPFRYAGDGPVLERSAPSIGQHTNDLLAELGYDETRIAGLRSAGAVA